MNAFIFLINTLGSLLCFLFTLRWWLQLIQADYYHSFTQAIVQYAQFFVKPLSYCFPTIRYCNTAALVAAILSGFLMLTLKLLLISGSIGYSIFGLFLFAIMNTVQTFIHLMILSIIVQAVLSWFQSPRVNYISLFLFEITNPIMRPIRAILPTLGGIDISPIPALIGLKFIALLCVDPVIAFAIQLCIK